jgi:hypothetical protein
VLRLESFVSHLFTSKPSWSTASYGHDADTTPMELSALGEHLNLCRNPHGRLFALHCAAESMHGFGATRFVTTLVIIASIIGVFFFAF